MSFGQRQERLANGQIVREFERSTGETTFISAPIYYYNDFFETSTPVLGEGWTESETGAATVTVPGDVGGGVARAATISNTGEAIAGAQSAQRFNVGVLSVSKFAQIEFRARQATGSSMAGFQGFLGLMGTIPPLTGSGVWPDATHHVGFTLGGPTDPLLQNVVDIYVSESDGVIASPRVDTGVDFAINATTPVWKTYRIDLSDLRDIKFYVDNVRVATNNTFAFHGTTEAISTMAVTFGLLRHPAGNGVSGFLDVDYVRFWAIR